MVPAWIIATLVVALATWWAFVHAIDTYTNNTGATKKKIAQSVVSRWGLPGSKPTRRPPALSWW